MFCAKVEMTVSSVQNIDGRMGTAKQKVGAIKLPWARSSIGRYQLGNTGSVGWLRFFFRIQTAIRQWDYWDMNCKLLRITLRSN